MSFDYLLKIREIKFADNISPALIWCKNSIPHEIFLDFDTNSQIESEQSVLERLLRKLDQGNFTKPAFGKQAYTTLDGRHCVRFQDSEELLCELSKINEKITPLYIAETSFELCEYFVLDKLLSKFPPIILQFKQSFYMDNNGNKICELYCQILAKPKPLVFWCFNCSCRQNKSTFIHTNGMLYDAYLHIKNHSSADVGSYYCCVLSSTAIGSLISTPTYQLNDDYLVTESNVSTNSQLKSIQTDMNNLYFSPTNNLMNTASGKIALIIGNTKFKRISSLRDDTKVLRLLAENLMKFNFQIILLQNLNQDELLHAVNMYESLLSVGVYGFFYISSHGLQINGQDYALTVDVNAQILKQIQMEQKSIENKEQYLTNYGFINIESLTCRFQSKNPYLNIMIMDMCRNSLGEKIQHKSEVNSAAQLNYYRKSNLFRLYASQPGQAAIEKDVSVLAQSILDTMKIYTDQTIEEWLNIVCEHCDKILKFYDKKLNELADYEKISKNKINILKSLFKQEPELQLPNDPIHTNNNEQFTCMIKHNIHVITDNYDCENELQSNGFVDACKRKLNDPIDEKNQCHRISCLWQSPWSSIADSRQSFEPNFNIKLITDSDEWYKKRRPNPIVQWLKISTPVHNVLRMDIKTSSITGLPEAYFKICELKQIWEPCEVEYIDEYISGTRPNDHYAQILIHNIQRLKLLRHGNDRIRLRLHQLNTIMCTPKSSTECNCNLIYFYIDSPPLVWLWNTFNIE